MLVLAGWPGCARGVEPAPAERSRSPFHTTPAEVAMDEPCRFLGTFHKESRRRVESLAQCHAIDEVQWSCLTRALKAVDRTYTARCKETAVTFATIERSQRARYAECFAEPDAAPISCGLLTGGDECLLALCLPEAPRPAAASPLPPIKEAP